MKVCFMLNFTIFSDRSIRDSQIVHLFLAQIFEKIITGLYQIGFGCDGFLQTGEI